MMYLWCPIGPLSFCEKVFMKRISKMKASLQVLYLLEDSQLQTTVPFYDLVSASQRSCSCSGLTPPTIFLLQLLNLMLLFETPWKLFLVVPYPTGHGLRLLFPALWGNSTFGVLPFMLQQLLLDSFLCSKPLVSQMLGHQPAASHHLTTALSAIASATHQPDWTCIEEVYVPIRQHALSFSIDQALQDDLIASAPSTLFRTLSLSTNLPHVCDWLNVVPSSTLGLQLRDREFRCCLCYWLEVPLHNNP